MKLGKDEIFSILESALFLQSEPVKAKELKPLFKNELSEKQLKNFLEEMSQNYEATERGVYLKKVADAYQLRTKPENGQALSELQEKKKFRLSGPSLEVLSILAYKQTCTKQEIDDIRGTESSHLLRTLMEKGLIALAGKSECPGKPSLYKTTQKFLEVFGLNSLDELPSEEEITSMIPANQKPEKPSLSLVENEFSNKGSIKIPFVKDEQENEKIKKILEEIPTNVKFLEKDSDQ